MFLKSELHRHPVYHPFLRGLSCRGSCAMFHLINGGADASKAFFRRIAYTFHQLGCRTRSEAYALHEFLLRLSDEPTTIAHPSFVTMHLKSTKAGSNAH